MRTIRAPQNSSRWLDELTAHARASPLISVLADATRIAWPFILFAWFAWQTYQRLSLFAALNFPIGIDAHIYYRGVVTWLHGQDPWNAVVAAGGAAYHYSGTPVTTVLLAPAGLIGEDAFVALSLVATWLGAVFILRRVHLPLWWLLFPPISEALFSANPQIVVLALLLAKSPWAAALGTALKVYAFIPLLGEGRWRAVALAVVVNAATIPLALSLWMTYIGEFTRISSRLNAESIGGYSAFHDPTLLAVTVAALLLLALRDRRAAGWLAVPAIWPASQLHYSTMALPVMTPILAFGLAIPILGIPPVVIVLEIVRRLVAPAFASRVADPEAPAAT